MVSPRHGHECMADGLSTCKFDKEGCVIIEPVWHLGQGARWSENEVAGRWALLVQLPEDIQDLRKQSREVFSV